MLSNKKLSNKISKIHKKNQAIIDKQRKIVYRQQLRIDLMIWELRQMKHQPLK